MNLHDIKSFAESLGASAFIRSLGQANDHDTLQICVDPVKVEETLGITAWRDAIFINKEENGWQLGFSQFGKTRQLADYELENLIKAWVNNPSYEHFKKYEA